MKVLVTGSDGYIGAVLVPLLTHAGHEVTGLDTCWFAHFSLGEIVPPPTLQLDVRDVRAHHLAQFDTVVHLAAISNDPFGDLDPALTQDINVRGTVRLAEAAKQAGVIRFVFSSSCSVYGAAAGDELLSEDSPLRPATAYGWSKVTAEEELHKLADGTFTPVFARNATAYGYSPRLRGDLVVNNLVGSAVTTGAAVLHSDGRAWRPLVHVEDLARALLTLVEAPDSAVHARTFNVGSTEHNYRVNDIAATVARLVEGSSIDYARGAGPDRRNYRVSCDRLRDELGFTPRWTLDRGIRQLADCCAEYRFTADDLSGPHTQRLQRIHQLLAAGRLTGDLRPLPQPAAGHA